MTTTLFLAFLLVMVTAVLASVARFRGGPAARKVGVALFAWFLYAGALSYSGFVATSQRPPGAVFIALPVVAFLVYVVARLSRGQTAFPLVLLVGAQAFRIGVELFLHELALEGIIPRMLTFDGANVDIFVGASAPVAAWLATRGPTGRKAALVWNILGLCALANVVSRAVMTTPGPLHLIHAEVENRMFGTFPFTFVPAFFVPLAFTLHVLALRTIAQKPGTERS